MKALRDDGGVGGVESGFTGGVHDVNRGSIYGQRYLNA